MSFNRRFVLCAIVVFVAGVGAASARAAQATSGGYAVVVSRRTHIDVGWRKVVNALVSKHNAEVIVHEGPVTDCLADLKKSFPRHACFVARPEEAGRNYVVAIHRLTRKLDGDPYTDVIWGILTGYRAADALRIATTAEPLIIRKAGAGIGLDLSLFGEGKWFSEGKAGLYCEKLPGGEPEKKTGPADSTKAIVDFLNEGRPDLFVTSGHATERDWQIGYSYKNGQFRCRDGELYGLDLKRKTHPIDSPNPKVYIGAGNCLIGHIRDRQSMALGWLGSGGARQMIGYTVTTWFGAMGWGAKKRLLDLPGRYSVSDSFFFSNQEIVYRLHSEFPKAADVELERFNLETDRTLMGRTAARLGYQTWDKTAKTHIGLLWDRDTVALYGDPAWEARLAPRDLPLTTTLTEKKGKYTFTVRATADCKPDKPLAMFLPHRVGDIKLLSGSEHEPLITDTFLMLMKSGPFEAGKTYKVTFQARRVGGDE